MRFFITAFCLILLLQFFVAGIDVEWVKQNPAEAFNVLVNRRAYFELEEQTQVVSLNSVEGLITIYCASALNTNNNLTSSIFAGFTFKSGQFQGKEMQLYLDSPLTEQPSFEAILQDAFVIEDSVLLSKTELVQRSKQTATQKQLAQRSTKVSRSFGAQTVLWIRVIYNDTLPAVGYPTEYNSMWSVLREMDVFLHQFSYNQASVDVSSSNITEPFILPYPKDRVVAVGGAGTMRNEAYRMAQEAGYDTSKYDFVVISFPSTSAFDWAGLGVLYGTPLWMNAGADGVYNSVLLHEIGHNIGLSHSNNIKSNSYPPSFGGNGQLMEYGDLYCNMGSGNTNFHWNIIKKFKIGWIQEAELTNLTAPYSGYINLYAFDQEINKGKQMGIYFSWNSVVSPNILFYMSYRVRGTGYDRLTAGAIEFRAGYRFYREFSPTEYNATHLIDATPNSGAELKDSMLTAGQTFAETGGSPSIYITTVSSKCNRTAINTSPCIVKGYVHYGLPVVPNTYTITVIPQDFDSTPFNYTAGIYTALRLISDVEASDPSQETAYFMDMGTVESFTAQGNYGTMLATSVSVFYAYGQASNMKGSSASTRFRMRYVQSKAYGEANLEGPFSINANTQFVRPIVNTGIAIEMHVVVNEDILGSAYYTRFTTFNFLVNETSGLLRFHTLAVDTNWVIGMSGFRFFYVNRLENRMQLDLLNSTTGNGTIALTYITPSSSLFLYRLVSISNRILTKLGSKQNTASYIRYSNYELLINGTGSVNILYPYSVTLDTVIEFELKTDNLGMGGHYISLQNTLQHKKSFYIEILPCQQQCDLTNNTLTYYAKSTLLDTYSVVSIPLGKEYLQTKDIHNSLYISLTNVNGGQMTVRRIRFYENRSVLPTVCSDASVRNSVLNYGTQNLVYNWRYRSRNNTNLSGVLVSSNGNGPTISGISVNDTIDVNLVITSSNTVVFNQTVPVRNTVLDRRVQNVVVPAFSSTRVNRVSSIVPRTSTIPANSPRIASSIVRNGTDVIPARSTRPQVVTSTVKANSSTVRPNGSTVRANPSTVRVNSSIVRPNVPTGIPSQQVIISYAQSAVYSVFLLIFSLILMN